MKIRNMSLFLPLLAMATEASIGRLQSRESRTNNVSTPNQDGGVVALRIRNDTPDRAQSTETTSFDRLRNRNDIPNHSEHIPAESRIVGGNRAPAGKFPNFVEWDGCGASLIHDDIILSAAHCNGISNNRVLIGAVRSGSTDDDAEFRNIVARRKHPNYNSVTLANDYLVMKLDNASTKPPMPLQTEMDFPVPGEVLTVVGFGATREGGWFGPTYLQEVDLFSVSHETCNDQYDGDIIEDIMLCAGVPGGGKDSCQGDSGGPIMDSNGVQVGVVSWGRGCGRPNYSGVYARVSGQIDWIQRQICDLSDYRPSYCDDLDDNSDYNDQNDDGEDGDGDNDNDENEYDENPYAKTRPIRLDFVFDDYPEESGYKVTRMRDGKVIVDYPAGSFNFPGPYTEILDLEVGEEYELLVRDDFGDGMCCDFGVGNYDLYAPYTDKVDSLLVTSDGRFQRQEKNTFIVPEGDETENDDTGDDNNDDTQDDEDDTQDDVDDDTQDDNQDNGDGDDVDDGNGDGVDNEDDGEGNTGDNDEIDDDNDNDEIDEDNDDGNDNSDNDGGDGDDFDDVDEGENNGSGCIDSFDAKFHVDAVMGEQDCVWLANNMERFGFLCMFLDVAYACPDTCSSCEYFV